MYYSVATIEVPATEIKMDQDVRNKLTDNQVYLGVDADDLDILERYKNSDARPKKGFYTDFSGVRTRLSYFGLTSHPDEEQIGRVPFPDDRLHAETIEYLGALNAVETSGDTFTAVELGAGYGPWIIFSAKAAQRKGISHINLLAVEADQQRLALIRLNLDDNHLPVPGMDGKAGSADVKVEIVHGAVSDTDGEALFGSQSILDWGAAAIEDGGNVDYRGAQVQTQAVKTYTIETALKDLETVDFMHMDIQGFEYRAVRASLDALQRKVRVLLIATHSRKIEGDLIGLLYHNGWRLSYEKPCKFALGEAKDLTSLTFLDDTQIWTNVALGSPAQATEDAATVLANHRLVLQARDRQIEELLNSMSWKITAPLRAIVACFKR